MGIVEEMKRVQEHLERNNPQLAASLKAEADKKQAEMKELKEEFMSELSRLTNNYQKKAQNLNHPGFITVSSMLNSLNFAADEIQKAALQEAEALLTSVTMKGKL